MSFSFSGYKAPLFSVMALHEEPAPAWSSGVDYKKGDIVYYGVGDPTVYYYNWRCGSDHTSAYANRPGEGNWYEVSCTLNSGSRYYNDNCYFIRAGKRQYVYTYDTSNIPDSLKNSTTGYLYFEDARPTYNYSNWDTGIYYSTGDIVLCNGTYYQCQTGHTSDDNNKPPNLWYCASTRDQYWEAYNDIPGFDSIPVPVKLNDSLIGTVDPGSCFTSPKIKLPFNPSSIFPAATLTLKYGWDDYDDLFAAATQKPTNTIPDDWAIDTGYVVGDSVVEDDIIYVCISAHTSSAENCPPNATYWAVGSNGWAVAQPSFFEHLHYPSLYYAGLAYSGIYIKPVYSYG